MKERLEFEFMPMEFTIRKMPDVSGVAVDSQGNIYYTTRICPGMNTPVVVIDSKGKYIRGIGTGLTKNAHGLCIDKEDNIYVVDGNRNCVFKFSNEGTLLMTIGIPDSPCDNGCINFDFNTILHSSDSFNHPAKIDVADNGDLYIADGYGNARVHQYSKDGKLIRSWGEPGDGPGQFRVVHGIGLDHENNDVYVCDRENERIQIFDSKGTLKAIWNDIWRPADICVDHDYVYIAELGELMFIDNVMYQPGSKRHHSQVRIFDKQGNEVGKIGTEDSGAAGSFFTAHGICLDHEQNILVGEVNIPYSDIWTVYPEGKGMSHGFHPFLQKFRRIH